MSVIYMVYTRHILKIGVPDALRLDPAGLRLRLHHSPAHARRATVELLTGESDLTIRTLSSHDSDYEGAAAFICAVLDNGAIRSEFPDVPADRTGNAALRLAAEQQMRLYTRSTIAPASPRSSLLKSHLEPCTTGYRYNYHI